MKQVTLEKGSLFDQTHWASRFSSCLRFLKLVEPNVNGLGFLGHSRTCLDLGLDIFASHQAVADSCQRPPTRPSAPRFGAGGSHQ